MEVGKLMSNTTPRDNNTSKDDEVMPPGFRFHPTDEELVGFYLRRQVEKKPICIELIKRVDIYKYDPWDLPGVSTAGDDKEWYFFCIRGRKYRNSTRPNRVTGSGFWKATGIDKPIYSTRGGRGATSECIGLKKSLVYYRGSAGKGGTKTDWMMHEFQLPPSNWKKNNNYQSTASSRNIPQEAEAWTLCRIFKRNASYYKQQQIPADWNEAAADAIFEQSLTSTDHAAAAATASSKTDSFEYSNHKKYTNLVDSIVQQKESKPVVVTIYNHVDDRNDQLLVGQHNSSPHDQLADHPVVTITPPPPPPHLSSWNNLNGDDDYAYFFRHENNWDELRSVVGLAMDSSINYYDRLQ